MDSYKTPLGIIEIKVLGHASLMIKWGEKYIYSDPYSEVRDFAGLPEADLILITHSHYDHYDEKAFSCIATDKTVFVVAGDVSVANERYVRLQNGDSYEYDGVEIYAVPSYNINRRNEQGELFHPKGVGNGYLLDFEGFRLYIAGDTEPIPEMRKLPALDIAFLPKNLPYTMTDEEFVQLANSLKPKYLYPIHYFELDAEKLAAMIDGGIKMMTDGKQY